jgi:hypothetical protein
MRRREAAARQVLRGPHSSRAQARSPIPTVAQLRRSRDGAAGGPPPWPLLRRLRPLRSPQCVFCCFWTYPSPSSSLSDIQAQPGPIDISQPAATTGGCRRRCPSCDSDSRLPWQRPAPIVAVGRTRACPDFVAARHRSSTRHGPLARAFSRTSLRSGARRPGSRNLRGQLRRRSRRARAACMRYRTPVTLRPTVGTSLAMGTGEATEAPSRPGWRAEHSRRRAQVATTRELARFTRRPTTRLSARPDRS